MSFRVDSQKNQHAEKSMPSESPMEYCERSIAIPLLDSLVNKLEDRYAVEGHQAHNLLRLVPAFLLSSDVVIKIEGLLFWQRDLPFPNSLTSEVRRWQALWHGRNE